MAKLKWKLEDLSLKCLDLRAFNGIKKKIETSSRLNGDILSNAIKPIKSELNTYKIKSNIFGRYKSISSIHRKIEKSGKKFEEIFKINKDEKLEEKILYMINNNQVIKNLIKNIKNTNSINLKPEKNVSGIVNSGLLKSLQFKNSDSSKWFIFANE